MNALAGSTIIPCLRYRDAHAAIDWLCRAFGFAKHAVYADGAVVHHAQLSYGAGMIMLGSVDPDNESEWSKRIVQPDEIGGRETQACCVIVDDADEHYARARAAGAQIVVAVADQDYGGRAYTCRDLEGRLWWFGTYNPWNL
ncbi:VOC family protein [Lysobacter sp. K5869]|uniref:VOC family protein n=1 Tax=Lysobacter sp. K5869 TaxID=2820808 RepID=UPI001C062402|nr:VOC family protein [Lysobacter sp. K5869]QWP76339.1 VOC family protein [Lysobacter sp. K5869]